MAVSADKVLNFGKSKEVVQTSMPTPGGRSFLPSAEGGWELEIVAATLDEETGKIEIDAKTIEGVNVKDWVEVEGVDNFGKENIQKMYRVMQSVSSWTPIGEGAKDITDKARLGTQRSDDEARAHVAGMNIALGSLVKSMVGKKAAGYLTIALKDNRNKPGEQIAFVNISGWIMRGVYNEAKKSQGDQPSGAFRKPLTEAVKKYDAQRREKYLAELAAKAKEGDSTNGTSNGSNGHTETKDAGSVGAGANAAAADVDMFA